jgi:hypothetical protein
VVNNVPHNGLPQWLRLQGMYMSSVVAKLGSKTPLMWALKHPYSWLHCWHGCRIVALASCSDAAAATEFNSELAMAIGQLTNASNWQTLKQLPCWGFTDVTSESDSCYRLVLT